MTLTQTTKKIATEVTENTKQTFIQKICNKLGENNKPIYTVMAIACGKGTVRPILSITDKKEKPDARKYAALRELMTEFIGVPTTLCAGLAAESLTGMLAKKGSVAYKNTKATLSLLGICIAAGYLVPKFCNIFMPPVMKKLMPSYDPNASSTPAKPTDAIKPVKVTTQQSFGAVTPLQQNNITRMNIHTPSEQRGKKTLPVYSVPSVFYHSGMKV